MALLTDFSTENSSYKWGFSTLIETDSLPKGLNEDIVKAISLKKNEPTYMLDFRLKAFRKWQEMEEPSWANIHYPPIDFQNIRYYSAPKKKPQLLSLDEADPELLKTFIKLDLSYISNKTMLNAP